MKIFIIHASAGAGHRKAAEALYSALTKIRPDARVEKIDILNYTNAFFRKAYPAVYIFLVTYLPAVWGLFFYLSDLPRLKPFINALRLFYNKSQAGPMLDYVLKEQPDVVVCAHFMSAQLMSDLKKKKQLKSRVIVQVTDFGVHQFWINEGTDDYCVASEITKKELIGKGIAEEQIRVTGIPVESKFSRESNKAEVRSKLKLVPDKFTILVTSGGFGVGPIKHIVEALDGMSADFQIAVVCGSNQGLCDVLQDKIFGKPVMVLGYVHNMDEFMEAADLIITKSGGLTVSESMAKKLPMVIIKPIPGQEARNAEIIVEYNTGLRLKNVAELPEQINNLLKDDAKALKQMRDNSRELAKPLAAENIGQWIIKELSTKS